MRRQRIRVAHLITNFPVGGAQDYLLMIVRNLDQTRFEPVVAGCMEGAWVSVVKSLPGVESFNIESLRRPISPYNDLKAVVQIWRFCKKQDIQILHTHCSKAGIAGRLGGYFARTPAVVHTIHGFAFNDFMPWWQRTAIIQVERVMSRFTTTLLLYSDGDRRTAEKYRIGARQSVRTSYYGVDYAPFEEHAHRRRVREGFGFSDQHQVIGFTGRICKQKGLEILVRAFAEVRRGFPQVRLLLVGDGPLRQELEHQIEQMHLRNSIVITGFRSEIPALLSAMDLFVMTSLWEGLSRSLAEAMFARLPIIATDVGGTSDAIRNNETGWLIPPNDVDAAVQALTEALANPERARTMADCGYAWARQAFDLNGMNKRMGELYEELVTGKRQSP